MAFFVFGSYQVPVSVKYFPTVLTLVMHVELAFRSCSHIFPCSPFTVPCSLFPRDSGIALTRFIRLESGSNSVGASGEGDRVIESYDRRAIFCVEDHCGWIANASACEVMRGCFSRVGAARRFSFYRRHTSCEKDNREEQNENLPHLDQRKLTSALAMRDGSLVSGFARVSEPADFMRSSRIDFVRMLGTKMPTK